MLHGTPTRSRCVFPRAPSVQSILSATILRRTSLRAHSHRRAAMSFVGNDDNLSCPICEVIYPTPNSAFVLSCSDEGDRCLNISIAGSPRYV